MKITTPTTWSAAGSPHRVQLVYVEDGGELTIEPCAKVVMDPGAEIIAYRTGRIVARGTESEPILFTAREADDPWGNIGTRYLTPTGFEEDETGGFVDLAHATLEGGGKPSLQPGMIISRGGDENHDLAPVDQMRLQHVTLRGSDSWGIYLDDGAQLTQDSTDLTITGSGEGAIIAGFHTAGRIPAGAYAGNTLDEIRLLRQRDALDSDLTLRAQDVPYRIGDQGSTDDFIIGTPTVAADPTTLTIEPGATLAFSANNGFLIELGGAIVAMGTTAAPITFTSAEPTPSAGDWIGLVFAGPGTGSSIDGAVIEYAGSVNEGAIGPHCVPAGGDAVSGYAAVTMLAQRRPRSSPHHERDRRTTGSPLLPRCPVGFLRDEHVHQRRRLQGDDARDRRRHVPGRRDLRLRTLVVR